MVIVAQQNPEIFLDSTLTTNMVVWPWNQPLRPSWVMRPPSYHPLPITKENFSKVLGFHRWIANFDNFTWNICFADIADGLVGVGLITQNEDMPGMLTMDKGYNDMSKFLNRILGMPVKLQNLLFKYFTDTLNSIIDSVSKTSSISSLSSKWLMTIIFLFVIKAKRSGRYDQGILDVGLTAEDQVELVRTHTFQRKHATGKAKIELHVLNVERGLSWDEATEKWAELTGTDEGFYLSSQVRNNKKTAILAVQTDSKKKGTEASKKEKMFIVYRPNTGQQVKLEPLSELRKKYKKVQMDEAETHWKQQYTSSGSKCSHAYWLVGLKLFHVKIEIVTRIFFFFSGEVIVRMLPLACNVK